MKPERMRKWALWILLMYTQQLQAQLPPVKVYYSVIEMPASIHGNYYEGFHPRLIAEDAARLLQLATGRIYTPVPLEKNADPRSVFLLLDEQVKGTTNETGFFESDGKSYVRIRARYATGLSYALYSWLHDLGYRFYLPGEEWIHVPKLAGIYNKKLRKKTYTPHFKMRMISASGGSYGIKYLDENNENGAEWRLWHQRNRMGCDYLTIDGHAGEKFNLANKETIEKDSMILAPVNGKRQYYPSGKIDPTYKKGVSLFASWITDEFQKNRQKFPSYLPPKKYASADAGDGLHYCHTPACEAAYASVSDQVFGIVNEAARKIKSNFPDAGVSTMAYTERADTPGIKIDPNVHVMVVASAFQRVSTPAELMKRWRKKTTSISQYDYLNIGVWSYDMPFFNLKRYHQYLRYAQTLKTDGFQFESSLSKFASGMQQYFILRFLAEPYTNIEKVLDEFCLKNFGKAAVPVKALLKEWYFSNTHIQTNFDRPSFYAEELGRFVSYLKQAGETPGISSAIQQRIDELKAYTVYLCRYYELFADIKSLKEMADNPARKNELVEKTLTFTWQMYRTKIFHNTQLNDLFKKMASETNLSKWDFRKSSYLNEIQGNTADIIHQSFDEAYQQYAPKKLEKTELPELFFAENIRFSPDSFMVKTMDESAFVNFVYPLTFYCKGPSTLKLTYRTGASQADGSKGKLMMAAVEKEDYSYISNHFESRELYDGTISFRLPSKGFYKLYLGQYQATPVNFTLFSKPFLFYHDKQMLLRNGMLLQELEPGNASPLKYLAVYAPPVDSLRFSNMNYNSNNSSSFFTAAGKKIPVAENKSNGMNSIPVPLKQKTPFVFFSNNVYRWPFILNNTAPAYFFLKYPL